MAVVTNAHKSIKTAAASMMYLKEQANDSAALALGYYGHGGGEVVFSDLGGKALAHLDGLELSLGLTRTQHADLHNGKWGDERLTRDGNYRHVWETNAQGRPIWVTDDSGRRSKIPVMEPVVDNDGHEVIDQLTGKPKMRQKTEHVRVNGYDVPFSLDKSWAEFLLAHPEHTETVRCNLLTAAQTAMRIAVEDHCEMVVRKNGGIKTYHKAELAWFAVTGMSARPTPESIARGYSADPHPHAHIYLFSSAYVDGEWFTLDAAELFKQAELRTHVASVEFNRLMELEGVRIDYSKRDRKGRVYSEVQGSNPAVRKFFSTNSQRAVELEHAYWEKFGEPPSKVEMNKMMAETKMSKSADAKVADEMGNIGQIARWQKALDEAGLEISIPKPGAPIKPGEDVGERVKELFSFVDSPEGIARDLDSESVFRSDAILLPMFRGAEGLGFSAEEVVALSEVYQKTLVVAEERVNAKYTKYTTKSILKSEAEIARLLEEKASSVARQVPDNVVDLCIRNHTFALDPEQVQLVKATCGDSQVVHGLGLAGSGKTVALSVGIDALRRQGLAREVIALSISRKRGNDTGKAVGARKGWSVEAMELAYSKGWRPTEKTIIIFDEVAMANCHQMESVMSMVGDARLITIGDNLQATPIGPAGWYAKALEAHPPVTLTRVHRQKDPRDRQDFALIREGRAAEALENLHARGRVFVADDPQHLVTVARERVSHYLDAGKQIEEIALVNNGLNARLDEMNRMVQQVLAERGRINEAEHFEVAEMTTHRHWRLHQGDRVVFNTGVYFDDLDETPVLNGTMGRISSINDEGECSLILDTEDRCVTIRLEPEAISQPIAPAYCMSTSKWQGGEVSVNLVLPGSPGVASLNSGYSQVTRGIDVTEILTDYERWGEHPLVRLGEAWSTPAEKREASIYFEEGIDIDDFPDLDVADAERTLEQLHSQSVSTDDGSLGLGLGMRQ